MALSSETSQFSATWLLIVPSLLGNMRVSYMLSAATESLPLLPTAGSMNSGQSILITIEPFSLPAPVPSAPLLDEDDVSPVLPQPTVPAKIVTKRRIAMVVLKLFFIIFLLKSI